MHNYFLNLCNLFYFFAFAFSFLRTSYCRFTNIWNKRISRKPSKYILSGIDRNRSVSGEDPTVNVKKGDIVIFDVDASRHQFLKKNKFSRGGGDMVTTGKFYDTRVTQNVKLSWNTSGATKGSYYYVCSQHSYFGMDGSIIVE